MAALHRRAFPADPWSEDFFALQLSLPGVFALTASEAGFVLARVAADEAEILTLAVSPEHRRRGIASALLSGSMNWAYLRGARSMLLEVSSSNVPALALYFRHGFRQVGIRHQYYADRSDALVLAAALPRALAQ